MMKMESNYITVTNKFLLHIPKWQGVIPFNCYELFNFLSNDLLIKFGYLGKDSIWHYDMQLSLQQCIWHEIVN